MNALAYAWSNYQNTLRKKWSIRMGKTISKPYQISIQPNMRCNARCVMCDCWHEKNDYINSGEVIGALKEIKKWTGGNFFVQIAGGEPLIYQGIYDIFKYCNQNNIVCKISTNGISFNESVCNKIIESGLKYLTVSLDSHHPEIHDKYRDVAGTFERATWGIKYLKANSKMVIGVSTILMNDNIGDTQEMTEYFLNLGADRVLFQPMRLFNEKMEDWTKHPYWINDRQKLDAAIDYLLEKKKNDIRIMNTSEHLEIIRHYFIDPYTTINKRKCYIGMEQLNINYKGDVMLCDAFGVIGNIKDGKIKEMWRSEKAEKIRKTMVDCKLSCTSNCKKELSLMQKINKFFQLYQSGLFD